MSVLETINSDGYEPTPATLAERVIQTTEKLELEGHEVKELEASMEEVTGAKKSVEELFMYL